MVVKIKLKNADKYLLLDSEVYEKLKQNKYFEALKVLDNIREHSSGLPVFQKYYKKKDGFKVETIYINQYVANMYIPKPPSDKRLFVSFKNGNKIDCRVKNLQWLTMSQLRREQRFTHNSTGFRGVHRVAKDKYISILWIDRQPVIVGTFKTPIEAARAYNDKSIELFGVTKSLNQFDESGSPVHFKKKVVERPRLRRKRRSKEEMTQVALEKQNRREVKAAKRKAKEEEKERKALERKARARAKVKK